MALLDNILSCILGNKKKKEKKKLPQTKNW